MNNSIGSPESHNETPVEIHRITWKGVEIEISWRREFLSSGWGHLELRSANKEPLTMTETWYRSHFLYPNEIDEHDWPVGYVEAWLIELDDGKPVQYELF